MCDFLGARDHSTDIEADRFPDRSFPAMLSPETATTLTFAIALVACWTVLHSTATCMKHQADVAELHRRVKQLREDYLRRSKAKRAEEVIEVGAAA